jgi:two-component system sensor histidine kinase MprB
LGTRFARNLSFEARLTLVAASAVAVAIVAAAAVVYFGVQTVLLQQVDDSLKHRADAGVKLQAQRGQLSLRAAPDSGGPGGYVQAVMADGTPLPAEGQTVTLPVSAQDLQVISGDAPPFFRKDWVGGTPVRIYTARFRVPGVGFIALEYGRPLAETYTFLDEVKLFLGFVSVGGIVLAALLGRLIAQAALGPIARLRAAVDHVAETRDMTSRVPDEGTDELGRLGSHFNRMLEALDQSLRTQRQLVADASHELRTPLASLRTNIEVLQRSPSLPEPDRGRLLKDVVAQVEQLTRLIGDLIDLARGDQTPEEKEEVRLDWIVAAAVERAAINWPAVRFETELVESVVLGQGRRLDRAVSNLLDNAGKWSPPGAAVDVRVTDHELVVRDHGPGIEPADLPYVFDRFWRAPAARGMPGSGLGLSIVRQVADAHGATVTAELPADGGTLMRFKFGDSKAPLSGS